MELDEIIKLIKNEASNNVKTSAEMTTTTEKEYISRSDEHTNKYSYHIIDFIYIDDHETFVTELYRAILKRLPDTEGFNSYVRNLKSGRFSKIRVALAIYKSEESKKIGVKIKGIYLNYITYFLRKIPLIGEISNFIFAIFCLVTLIDRFIEILKLKSKILIDLENISNDIQNMKHDVNYLKANILSELENCSNEIQNLKSDVNNIKYNILSELENKLQQKIIELEKSIDTKANINELRIYHETLKHTERYFSLTANNIENLLKKLESHSNRMIDREEIKHLQKYYYDKLYLDFETFFRGAEKTIKENLTCYNELFQEILFKTKEKKALDLGCGRGELLELLKEYGFYVTGVDTNSIAIIKCREKNINAIQSDIFEYLDTLPDNSISLITLIHVVEHFEYITLLNLLKKIHAKLEEQGAVLLETPNPRNSLVGSSDFYRDFTHIRPIFPDTLKFLIDFIGFKRTKIYLFDNSSPRKLIPYDTFTFDTFQKYIDISRDYAIIGYK